MNHVRRKRLQITAASFAAAATLAACSGGSSGGGSDAGSASAGGGTAISVWVDAARVPAIDALKKKYPDLKLDVTTISNTGGSSGLQQKFTLFNQTGSGWPDVIFFGGIDDIAWAASKPIDYAADLTDKFDATFWKGYSDAAIAPCVQGDSKVCLRNDQAQDVLWYNSSLFTEWGYTPPTTWEEYESLSLKIAAEHPGYYTGVVGDSLATARYLWASGCPTNALVKDETVKINLDDPACTRVRDMLDKLVAAGVVAKGGIFDPDVATTVGPNLVMTPGATWYGKYLFRDTFKVPAGQITATTPMSWGGGEVQTGNEGGGLWVASKHLDEAKWPDVEKIMTFMVSDPTWQVDLTTGYPAYQSVQQGWLDNNAKDGYFANVDAMNKAFISAGAQVAPYSLLKYNTGDIWTKTISAQLASGGTIGDSWSAFSDELNQEAKTFGYTVVAK